MSGQLNPLMIAYSFRGRREVDESEESDGKISANTDTADDLMYKLKMLEKTQEERFEDMMRHIQELKKVKTWLLKSGDKSSGRLRKQNF